VGGAVQYLCRSPRSTACFATSALPSQPPLAELLAVAATMLDVSEPLFSEVKRLVKGVEVRGHNAAAAAAAAAATTTR